LISRGVGVALPAVGALKESLVAIGRESDEARRMIENGVFCDELGRSIRHGSCRCVVEDR
jgi:hypothetical protein